MKKEPLLLLTACVNPNGMTQTAFQDADERLKQYLEAIQFYLDKTNFPILIVENTSVNFNDYFLEYVKSGRLECLSFNGNNYPRSLGKGFGEGIILQYAFNYSKTIHEYNWIVKITGRHKVVNIKKLVGISKVLIWRRQFIITEISPKQRFCRSDIFIASKKFYLNYLIPNLSLCNDLKNIWFENMLFQSVLSACHDGFNFLYVPICPCQEGVSGSSGVSFKKPRVRRHIRFFFTMIGYLLRVKRL